jgi:ribosomal protein S12 methylthiotransferase accessory factor YcaO
MKKAAKADSMLEVFEKFFAGYEFETIDDLMFTERVERFENAIFGI